MIWFGSSHALAQQHRLSLSLSSLLFLILNMMKSLFPFPEFWWLQAVRNTWWLIRKLLDAARCYTHSHTPFSPLCRLFSPSRRIIYTAIIFISFEWPTRTNNKNETWKMVRFFFFSFLSLPFALASFCLNVWWLFDSLWYYSVTLLNRISDSKHVRLFLSVLIPNLPM